jgi:hypothetical protein
MRTYTVLGFSYRTATLGLIRFAFLDNGKLYASEEQKYEEWIRAVSGKSYKEDKGNGA